MSTKGPRRTVSNPRRRLANPAWRRQCGMTRQRRGAAARAHGRSPRSWPVVKPGRDHNADEVLRERLRLFRRLMSLPTVPMLQAPGPGTRSWQAFARSRRRGRTAPLPSAADESAEHSYRMAGAVEGYSGMGPQAPSAALEVARSERFELPTLGIEIRCSIQLSYERVRRHHSGAPPECQPQYGPAKPFPPGSVRLFRRGCGVAARPLRLRPAEVLPDAPMRTSSRPPNVGAAPAGASRRHRNLKLAPGGGLAQCARHNCVDLPLTAARASYRPWMCGYQGNAGDRGLLSHWSTRARRAT